MRRLAHLSETSTSTRRGWPVPTEEYPRHGALLPFNRIVAFYGNFYSTQMGILGELPEDELLEKIRIQTDEWRAADPSTPVIPAIEYIATVAQAGAGKDGMYRARMPDEHIERAIKIAEKIDGIVILDVQSGLADKFTEAKALDKYLRMPRVHLALDPEFAMKNGAAPGTVVGTMSADEINKVAEYLQTIVREEGLPPKILLLHRFTRPMITNSSNIRPLPEVQMVVQMDGWGTPEMKKDTYNFVITEEPVQFAGFKIFYKNDTKRVKGSRLMQPKGVLELLPSPIFIQYQ